MSRNLIVHLRKVQFSFSSNCVESCEHKRIKNIFWILVTFFIYTVLRVVSYNQPWWTKAARSFSMHHRVLLLQFSFKCHSQQFAHMTWEVKKHSFMTTSKRLKKRNNNKVFKLCCWVITVFTKTIWNCSILTEISNVIEYWRLSQLPTIQFLRQCFCGKMPKVGHNKNKEKHRCT